MVWSLFAGSAKYKRGELEDFFVFEFFEKKCQGDKEIKEKKVICQKKEIK